MADYEFVCHECGRTFRGLTSHIGDEMCPECGSIDIAVASEFAEESASPDDRGDAPAAGGPSTAD